MSNPTSAPSYNSQTPAASNNDGRPHFLFTKDSIIWLTVVSTLLLVALILVLWLLFPCRSRKRRLRHSNGHSHHPSLEVTDGRNEFATWNRTVPKGPSQIAYPLATIQPRNEAHPGVPVIVDESESSSSVTRRNRGGRYYNGIGNAWNRMSHIGKAF